MNLDLEAKEKFSAMTNARMKDFLKENLQSRSGNKGKDNFFALYPIKFILIAF